MAKFFAGVLSVIAVGVLLIAYGLLSPRAAAYGTAPFDPLARPMLAGEQISLDDPYAARYYYGATGNAPIAPYGYVAVPAAAPVRAVATLPVTAPVATPVVATQPVRTRTQVVERAPGRNWQKTALVIGGTTAAGAGVGGLIGGKKGALIGAAIGGGGSTLYEAMKK